MKIGILSDSHGKNDRLASALKLLVGGGAEVLVHCGDIGSAWSVELLGQAGPPAYLVMGNIDRHADDLQTSAQRCGVHLGWEVVEVPIGPDRYLLATHGHDEQLLDELITGQQFPFICHGHTHHARNQQIGKIRVINPGALHNTRRCSVALLDTAAGEVEFIVVP